MGSKGCRNHAFVHEREIHPTFASTYIDEATKHPRSPCLGYHPRSRGALPGRRGGWVVLRAVWVQERDGGGGAGAQLATALLRRVQADRRLQVVDALSGDSNHQIKCMVSRCITPSISNIYIIFISIFLLIGVLCTPKEVHYFLVP